MPLYNYRCRECSLDIEVKHSITSNPIVLCQNCSAETSRVPQAAGIVLKSPGFYKTDSRVGDNK